MWRRRFWRRSSRNCIRRREWLRPRQQQLPGPQWHDRRCRRQRSPRPARLRLVRQRARQQQAGRRWSRSLRREGLFPSRARRQRSWRSRRRRRRLHRVLRRVRLWESRRWRRQQVRGQLPQMDALGQRPPGRWLRQGHPPAQPGWYPRRRRLRLRDRWLQQRLLLLRGRVLRKRGERPQR